MSVCIFLRSIVLKYENMPMALLSIEAQLKYALLTRPIWTDRTTNNTNMCGKKTFGLTELESERVNEQLFIRFCLKTQQEK